MKRTQTTRLGIGHLGRSYSWPPWFIPHGVPSKHRQTMHLQGQEDPEYAQLRSQYVRRSQHKMASSLAKLLANDHEQLEKHCPQSFLQMVCQEDGDTKSASPEGSKKKKEKSSLPSLPLSQADSIDAMGCEDELQFQMDDEF